jgi:hypothetical protein
MPSPADGDAAPLRGLDDDDVCDTPNDKLLSFWDLCLGNMPQERFEQRTLTASEARTLIARPAPTRRLLCVSREDLIAPKPRTDAPAS